MSERGGTVSVNVFDQAARFAVQSDPIGFFRWLTPGLDASLRFQGWLDTRTLPFPGDPDRICDTVAHLAEDAPGGPRWAVVTEFQTEPEPDMLDRLLEYLARLRRGLRHGPQGREKFEIVAAMVGLTGAPQPGLLEMGLPGQVVPSLRFHVVVRTLREENAAATLADIASHRTSRCLLSWVSLMRGAGESSIIELWKQVADTEPDRVAKATYAALALTFAELAGNEVAWRTELEGWNMRESTVVNEWKAEGKIEGEHAALLRLLRVKFQVAVPADLAAAVERQSDLGVLAAWSTQAILASSLDDFRKAVNLLP